MQFDNHLFDNIFKSVVAYVSRDFSNIQTQTEGDKKANFCIFTYQTIFDLIEDYLTNKVKYSGEIFLEKNAVLQNLKIDRREIIEKNKNYKKGKLILTEQGGLKYNINYKKTDEQIAKKAGFSKANNDEKKTKITIFPLDGTTSFFNGIADFSIAVAFEELESDNYAVKNMLIYNPFGNNIYSFSSNGAFLNNTKIADNSEISNDIKVFYVNSGVNPCRFDITKVASKTSFFATSTSIFLTICNLVSNQNAIIIYSNDNDEKEKYVEFLIKSFFLSSRKIGNHLIIGKEEALKKVVK